MISASFGLELVLDMIMVVYDNGPAFLLLGPIAT